jgi:hypothetical protein
LNSIVMLIGGAGSKALENFAILGSVR